MTTVKIPLFNLFIGWMLQSLIYQVNSTEVSNETQQCASAPNEDAKAICMRLEHWSTKAKSREVRPEVPPEKMHRFADGHVEVIVDLLDCGDMACVCKALTGSPSTPCTYKGIVMKKVVRKEYRMMNFEERSYFWAALRELKRSGAYDEFTRYHYEANDGGNGGAHGGPAFLPWHRETLKRLELSLRRIDPRVFVPYWDSVLDSYLNDKWSSALFSDELAGPSDRLVTSGPFQGFSCEANAFDRCRATGIQRRVDEDYHNVFNEGQLQWLWNYANLSSVLARSIPPKGAPRSCGTVKYSCLEMYHGLAHNMIGGDMLNTNTSPRDPLFYMHHSFTDLIWEEWRQRRQTRGERETAWPRDPSCSTAQHTLDWPMAPYTRITNLDGLSNKYTDELYEYAPRPTCSATSDCGSSFLFCDRSGATPKCVAKMLQDGRCAQFGAGDACYLGYCNGGYCQWNQ